LLISRANKRTVSKESAGFFRPMQDGDFSLPLRSAGSRLALILLVGIPAVIFSFKVTQITLAARYGRRFDASDLRRAIALDPGNAAYDHQLGLVCAYSFDHPNLSDALVYLRRATELNPLNALYWSDLAEVCDTMNDTACSNQAVQQALILGPTTPQFEWKAGNHYLLTGKSGEALDHFRCLLALDATYAQPVFEVCLRVVGNPQTIFQKVIPAGKQTRVKLAYLDVLGAQGHTNFANQVWKQMLSEGLSCKFSDIKPYLDSLFAEDEMQQAAAVWRQLQQAGVIPRLSDSGAENLVYNGQFVHTPLDAGFGWRAPGTPDVEADFQDPSGYHSSHCLRVDYAAGKNLELEPVFQFVGVVPGRAYRLQAEVRSDSITSDSGPRLRVTDPDCPTCLNALTETTVGTTAWHQVTLDFKAGAQTCVVRLSVWRARSWTFPMEISGSFWLDDVSITPLNSATGETASTN
jgi:hypothetical protein